MYQVHARAQHAHLAQRTIAAHNVVLSRTTSALTSVLHRRYHPTGTHSTESPPAQKAYLVMQVSYLARTTSFLPMHSMPDPKRNACHQFESPTTSWSRAQHHITSMVVSPARCLLPLESFRMLKTPPQRNLPKRASVVSGNTLLCGLNSTHRLLLMLSVLPSGPCHLPPVMHHTPYIVRPFQP